MQVVVLMGGLGTRLGQETLNIPKSMVDVHGKPFFYYQLELMKWYGFKNFLFCVGHLNKSIEDYFGDGSSFDVNIKYSYDRKNSEGKLLGTGGALRNAMPLLENDFLLIYGDSYMDINYPELIFEYFTSKNSGKKSLLSVYKNENTFYQNNVIFKNNRLILYDKKNFSSEMEHIDFGVSIFDRSLIARIPEGEFSDLSDLQNQLTRECLATGYEALDRFYEIGTPATLEEFKKFIYGRIYISKPAIFLDRDGTINEIVFNDDTEQMDSPLKTEDLRLLPGVEKALFMLQSMGYLLIVVSNQPAAAKGKISLGNLFRINAHLKKILHEYNVHLDDVLICPHHPTGEKRVGKNFLVRECICRKPGRELLTRAIDKFNIDRFKSFMVGDSHVDILAGRSAGVKTVFLGNYKCDLCKMLNGVKPDYLFRNLYDFALYLQNSNKPGGKNDEPIQVCRKPESEDFCGRS
jgi:histidinol-phosphate phosphatase family protein